MWNRVRYRIIHGRFEMKNSKQCPKCKSHDLIRIPGSIGAYGGGNHIPVGNKASQSVLVTRFVCMNCGYSEEWIEDDEARKRLRKGYH